MAGNFFRNLWGNIKKGFTSYDEAKKAFTGFYRQYENVETLVIDKMIKIAAGRRAYVELRDWFREYSSNVKPSLEQQDESPSKSPEKNVTVGSGDSVRNPGGDAAGNGDSVHNPGGDSAGSGLFNQEKYSDFLFSSF